MTRWWSGAAWQAFRSPCERPDTGAWLSATHLLIAAGRAPNTDGLGLDEIGIEPDEDGYIEVDDQPRTGVEDVWALGDLRGGPMFTHTARDDADAIYRNVFRSEDRSVAGRIVPHAVFVDPEVASVGIGEQAARTRATRLRSAPRSSRRWRGRRPSARCGGWSSSSPTPVQTAFSAATLPARSAGNLIHEVVIAMVAGASYGDIRGAIHVHPTLAEAVNSAAGGVHRPPGA